MAFTELRRRWNLPARVCELEDGFRTLITPGGQCAISLINLAFLKAGDHVLIPESVYTPSRKFAAKVLRKFGVEVGFYPPEAGSADLRATSAKTRAWCGARVRDRSRWKCRDVPSIAEVAHRAGAMVVMDNTWSAGVYFDAFAHGVDVTMQALTKYVGGHSDLLLGSITTRETRRPGGNWERPSSWWDALFLPTIAAWRCAAEDHGGTAEGD